MLVVMVRYQCQLSSTGLSHRQLATKSTVAATPMSTIPKNVNFMLPPYVSLPLWRFRYSLDRDTDNPRRLRLLFADMRVRLGSLTSFEERLRKPITRPYQGGANTYGTVFKITPSGTLTTLHSFNSTDGRIALLPIPTG